MTADDIIRELRPLALKLYETPDEQLEPMACAMKGLICLVMGLGEQIPPSAKTHVLEIVANQIYPIMALLEAHFSYDREG